MYNSSTIVNTKSVQKKFNSSERAKNSFNKRGLLKLLVSELWDFFSLVRLSPQHMFNMFLYQYKIRHFFLIESNFFNRISRVSNCTLFTRVIFDFFLVNFISCIQVVFDFIFYDIYSADIHIFMFYNNWSINSNCAKICLKFIVVRMLSIT